MSCQKVLQALVTRIKCFDFDSKLTFQSSVLKTVIRCLNFCSGAYDCRLSEALQLVYQPLNAIYDFEADIRSTKTEFPALTGVQGFASRKSFAFFEIDLLVAPL